MTAARVAVVVVLAAILAPVAALALPVRRPR